MESEGPYTTGLSEGLVFKDNRVVENFDSERDKLNACRLANAAHAEGRKAAEKEYKELLEITGFLANVLNEIAYGFVHERDDIPGEGCNCNDDYAKAALELSYEDFIDWRRRHGGLNEKH